MKLSQPGHGWWIGVFFSLILQQLITVFSVVMFLKHLLFVYLVIKCEINASETRIFLKENLIKFIQETLTHPKNVSSFFINEVDFNKKKISQNISEVLIFPSLFCHFLSPKNKIQSQHVYLIRGNSLNDTGKKANTNNRKLKRSTSLPGMSGATTFHSLCFLFLFFSLFISEQLFYY